MKSAVWLYVVILRDTPENTAKLRVSRCGIRSRSFPPFARTSTRPFLSASPSKPKENITTVTKAILVVVTAEVVVKGTAEVELVVAGVMSAVVVELVLAVMVEMVVGIEAVLAVVTQVVLAVTAV